MKRKFVFKKGGLYRIHNSGAARRKAFASSGDRDRFVRLLELCNTPEPFIWRIEKNAPSKSAQAPHPGRLVDICAYAVTPNSFNLILRERTKGGISAYMKKMLTAYSMYYNKKYCRSGALFAGRFRAEAPDNETCLDYWFLDIHILPIRHFFPEGDLFTPELKDRLLSRLAAWRHSSYLDLIGRRPAKKSIIALEAVPPPVSRLSTPERFIEEWLAFNEWRAGDARKNEEVYRGPTYVHFAKMHAPGRIPAVISNSNNTA